MEYLTIDEAHTGFSDYRFTCRELVSYYLKRIEVLNGELPSRRGSAAPPPAQPGLIADQAGSTQPYPDSLGLNAIVTVSETALREAEELDEYYGQGNTFKGSLHGIPIIVKDSIATAGLTTTYGSVKTKDHVPDEDATVIKKLKDAGAIILAKSTMPDWSASWHCTSSLSGTTKNPFDLRCDPCSGTGAAIAADLAILGLDTDTDGNVRLPASFCSLVGLRPRPGMISRHGTPVLVHPQDTPGPICRTVRDVALMYEAMVGFDPNDTQTSFADIRPPEGEESKEIYAVGLSTAEASKLRIGVVDSLFGSDEDSSCQAVNRLVRSALECLQERGARVVPLSIPHLRQWMTTTFLYGDRSRSDLDSFFAKSLPHLGLSVKDISEAKEYHPAQDLFELIAKGSDDKLDPKYAYKLQRHVDFRPEVMAKMHEAEVDFLAFPVCQIPPPLTDDILKRRWSTIDFPTNTMLAGQALLPAISVPVGATEDGLPVGMELVSSPHHEKELLEAAAVVEREVGGTIRPRLENPQ